MPNRAPDWLAQAVRDLEQARSSAAGERHEWALQSEQAILYAGAIIDYVRPQMA